MLCVPSWSQNRTHGAHNTTQQSDGTAVARGLSQPRRDTERNRSYDSLVGFHFNVVAGYEALLAVQLGSVPVHVVLHVQDL